MRMYEDLKRLLVNLEPPRTHYIPYDTLEKALSGDKNTSAYYMLLNGVWDFKYYEADALEENEIVFTDSLPVP